MGIEIVLQWFDLYLFIFSFASDQNIVVTIKDFSLQHSSPLTGVVCTTWREHMKIVIEFMYLLVGTKLEDIEVA